MRTRWRIRVSPWFAAVGVAAIALSVLVHWLAGWPAAIVTAVSGLIIVGVSLDRHPPEEPHTGPFARCQTPPHGLVKLTDDYRPDETIPRA